MLFSSFRFSDEGKTNLDDRDIAWNVTFLCHSNYFIICSFETNYFEGKEEKVIERSSCEEQMWNLTSKNLKSRVATSNLYTRFRHYIAFLKYCEICLLQTRRGCNEQTIQFRVIINYANQPCNEFGWCRANLNVLTVIDCISAGFINRRNYFQNAIQCRNKHLCKRDVTTWLLQQSFSACFKSLFANKKNFCDMFGYD